MSRLVKLFAPAALLLAACMEPDVRVIPSQPLWMEWPAEARAGVPFGMQLAGYAPGCFDRQELRVDVERFDEGVAFRALWVVQGESDPACDPGFYDTTVTVAGLAAAAERTYLIWRVNPDAPQLTTVGSVVVRPTDPVSSRANAAGVGNGFTDIEGCAVMQRILEAPVPVENPPAPTWQGFVFGYFFTPTAPLCGQTRAFHVDSLRAP